MADTLPDFKAPTGSWIDVYAQTGITVGASIAITNKSSYEIIVKEQAAAPADSDTNGSLIATINTGTYQAILTGTPTGVWIKSSGDSDALVNVQEI